MRGLSWSAVWKTGLPVVLALAGLLAAWAVDRNSLERANRLYRGGDPKGAAAVYADRLARDTGVDEIRYNLGTALLGLGDKGAGEALAGVGPKADVEVRVRALNNLGLWRLNEAAKALGQSAARKQALGAVEAYRTALRLQPGRTDASWNLAIALRMLASIEAGDYQNGGDAPEGAREREAGSRPDEDPGETKEEEEAPAGPKAGEGETAARASQTTPLSQDEAAEILGAGHRDPTAMVSKLLAFEGRALRQRASGRPAVGGPD